MSQDEAEEWDLYLFLDDYGHGVITAAFSLAIHWVSVGFSSTRICGVVE